MWHIEHRMNHAATIISYASSSSTSAISAPVTRCSSKRATVARRKAAGSTEVPTAMSAAHNWSHDHEKKEDAEEEEEEEEMVAKPLSVDMAFWGSLSRMAEKLTGQYSTMNADNNNKHNV